jgi:hypothetical protein
LLGGEHGEAAFSALSLDKDSQDYPTIARIDEAELAISLRYVRLGEYATDLCIALFVILYIRHLLRLYAVAVHLGQIALAT